MSTPQHLRVARRDAARNRDRIVGAARRTLAEGRPLQFNEIARTAEVGVGTVYRQFSTPEALREAVVLDRLEALQRAAAALDADRGDAWESLADFLRLAFTAQCADPALTEVIAQPVDTFAETAAARAALGTVFARRMASAEQAALLRPGVTAADVTGLLCSTAAAAHAAGPGHEVLYLEILLAGLRATTATAAQSDLEEQS